MATVERKTVLIDTNVIIFAMKPQPKEDPVSEKDRHEYAQIRNALAFLDQCEKARDIVVISSISVGELLEGLEEEKFGEALAIMENAFKILPFGTGEATLAASLARRTRANEKNSGAKGEGEKTKLNNDRYILATGIQAGCTDFYTTDKELLKQAAKLEIPMQVHPLPDAPPEQLDLPYDDIANSRQG